MGKMLMILILGAFVSFGILNFSSNDKVGRGTTVSVNDYSSTHTKNIANSTAELLISKLTDNVEWRVTNPQEIDLFGGTAEYTITKVPKPGTTDSLLKISVTAYYNGDAQMVDVFLRETSSSGGWIPPVVRAAWTANGDLNETISDMYIDGRDHKVSDLSIVPKTGVKGVSLSVPFVNKDDAAIGGTADSVDYPMSFPENPAIIEENYNWGGSFPTSPDEILGYPEGTLKSLGQSGKNGSQYVNDPKDLTFPLSGVTYVEILDGKEHKLKLEGKPGKKGKPGDPPNTGMLIVHAPGCSSKLKQIKSDMPFIGLVVTDYSFHHHFDVLGAMLQLSPDLQTEKGCNGNRDHWVYYSSEAIKSATGKASQGTGLIGNNSEKYTDFGFGKKRLVVEKWTN